MVFGAKIYGTVKEERRNRTGKKEAAERMHGKEKMEVLKWKT